MIIRYKFLYVFLNLLALWSLKDVAVVATSTDSVPRNMPAINRLETLPWGLTTAPAIAASEKAAHFPFIAQLSHSPFYHEENHSWQASSGSNLL